MKLSVWRLSHHRRRNTFGILIGLASKFAAVPQTEYSNFANSFHRSVVDGPNFRSTLVAVAVLVEAVVASTDLDKCSLDSCRCSPRNPAVALIAVLADAVGCRSRTLFEIVVATILAAMIVIAATQVVDLAMVVRVGSIQRIFFDLDRFFVVPLENSRIHLTLDLNQPATVLRSLFLCPSEWDRSILNVRQVGARVLSTTILVWLDFEQ